MQQTIIDFIKSADFDGLFNVPFQIITGDLKNYNTDSSLKKSKGIYFIHCEKLGVAYIGMTNSGAAARFERHIGRSEGETYGDKHPAKNWDYFYTWCQNESHDFRNSSQYTFVKFEVDLTKDHLEWLEDTAVKKFKPLINAKSFHLFGFHTLEKLKTVDMNPAPKQETNLFIFE